MSTNDMNLGVTPHDPSPPVRVLLAEDQILIRDSFKLLIDATPGLTTVGEAGTGAEAVLLARRHRPDVILMDVRMPDMDGIEATERLLGRAGAAGAAVGPKVVVLTTFDLDEYALAAIQAGASGFLLKDAPPEELLAAIRTVHRGDAVIAPSTTRRLLDHVAPLLRAPGPDTGRHVAAVESLTPREREVFTLIAQGLSNPEIAAQLYLSEATVKTHVGHILGKLGARDRVQAVVIAYEAGLVAPGS
jgi:DNA-binding NarL/FixJ family response regulator